MTPSSPDAAFDKWLKKPGKWLEGTGPYAEIAVSSRIRLARNLHQRTFPMKANQEAGQEVLRLMKEAALKVPSLKGALTFEMNQLNALDRRFLIERHLISHDLSEQKRFGSAVIIDPAEHISLMVNEEDHFRLQIIFSGLDLGRAWKEAAALDHAFSEVLMFAFSPNWGHLTSCPTNAGTGLRASVMLHLPALVFQRKAEKMLQRASQLGLVVRGLYGEGSEVKSVFFQISNQVSLGKSEEEIIENVVKLTRQLSEYEHQAREWLMTHQRMKIEDSVWRAYGTLSHARTLTSSEATDLLSTARLGVELGLIPKLSMGVLNELLVMAQPAHIQKRLGKEMDEAVRDQARAEYFRDRLKRGSATG